MKISARGLKLHEMFPNTSQPMHASVGQLHGDAALSGTGNSIAALLGSSNGEVNAVITQGSVSKLILEAMGLNIGGTVAAMLFGDRGPAQLHGRRPRREGRPDAHPRFHG